MRTVLAVVAIVGVLGLMVGAVVWAGGPGAMGTRAREIEYLEENRGMSRAEAEREADRDVSMEEVALHAWRP